jgi:hypothetical protein
MSRIKSDGRPLSSFAALLLSCVIAAPLQTKARSLGYFPKEFNVGLAPPPLAIKIKAANTSNWGLPDCFFKVN